jgi:hypothetical protein
LSSDNKVNKASSGALISVDSGGGNQTALEKYYGNAYYGREEFFKAKVWWDEAEDQALVETQGLEFIEGLFRDLL